MVINGRKWAHLKAVQRAYPTKLQLNQEALQGANSSEDDSELPAPEFVRDLAGALVEIERDAKSPGETNKGSDGIGSEPDTSKSLRSSNTATCWIRRRWARTTRK